MPSRLEVERRLKQPRAVLQNLSDDQRVRHAAQHREVALALEQRQVHHAAAVDDQGVEHAEHDEVISGLEDAACLAPEQAAELGVAGDPQLVEHTDLAVDYAAPLTADRCEGGGHLAEPAAHVAALATLQLRAGG